MEDMKSLALFVVISLLGTVKATSQISMTDPPTLYFGYGSNLWREQMELRCPDSQYLGIARLNDWRWIINDRGYANVVVKENDTVWGMVYSLTESDERRLDANEGVPEVYEKKMKTIEFWPAVNEEMRINVGGEGKGVDMLVYIDFQRTEPAKPKKEYIYRMNRAVEDALKSGIPQEYVDEVIRKYIPKDDESDEETKDLAEKQARQFEDE